jgi:hypothetical protein
MSRLTARTFAERFPVEQAAFARGIHGLPTAAAGDYASVLLHRLMFLWFLQQNGHGDSAFLLRPFARHRQRRPALSLWRGFLLPLFHGRRSRRSQPRWADLFTRHAAEEPASSVDVDDSAFDRLFTFFDAYEWSLPATPTADAGRLTPALIGPLFEKHVNRAEQGAYYTRDDVTAYLATRTIIPCALDRARQRCPAAFDGVAWRLLRADPDRYILASVRSETVLPTETKPEEQARRRRCRELRERLRTGQVSAINDLVTLNLDLERFAQDLIATADATLRPALMDAVAELRILDPTCGSGAFLVAALHVLDRLWSSSQDSLLRRRHIVSKNLFGVDIHAEAVELCRLRLLVELAAATNDLGDLSAAVANIRVGNALTGAVWASGRRKPTGNGDRGTANEGQRLGLSSFPVPRSPFPVGLFQWSEEFSDVMRAGGFDVILGNPPYLPAKRVRRSYAIPDYRTADCPDVYAWVLERSAALVKPGGRCGMIVPLSLSFSDAFASCRRLLFESYGENWFASFGRIPAALFAGDVRVRNTVHIGHRSPPTGRQYTTRLHRWFEAARPQLFETLEYVSFHPDAWGQRVPKLNTPGLGAALEHCLRRSTARLSDVLVSRPTRHVLHFKKTAYNWLTFCRRLPDCFDANGLPTPQTQYDALYFADAVQRDLALLLLNGKWAYAFWSAVGDDFHVARWMFGELPIDLAALPAKLVTELRPLARALERAMHAAPAFKRNAGKRVGTYNLARCRHVTDRSDSLFAEALGLRDVWPDLELLVAQVVKTDFDV